MRLRMRSWTPCRASVEGRMGYRVELFYQYIRKVAPVLLLPSSSLQRAFEVQQFGLTGLRVVRFGPQSYHGHNIRARFKSEPRNGWRPSAQKPQTWPQAINSEALQLWNIFVAGQELLPTHSLTAACSKHCGGPRRA